MAFNRSLRFATVGLLALAAGAVPTLAFADDSKALQATRQGAGSSAEVPGLRFELQAIKAAYDVGEPVRLRVRGSRPFFLTVFSEDLDTGRVTTLLPSRAQVNNKYPGGAFYTVPNPGVTFSADRPGRVRITAVASTKSIDIDVSKFKAEGDFYSVSSEEFYKTFESKGIRIRPMRRPSVGAPPSATPRQPAASVTSSGASFVLQTADITIRPVVPAGFSSPHADQPASPSDGAVVLLSGDRDVYRIGETARFVFGADKPGTVTLYVIEPGGSYGELLSRRVEANIMQSIQAQVEAPVGGHTVLAVFDADDKKERSHDDVVAQILSDGSGKKGLRLINDRPAVSVPVHSVFEFRVVR